MPETLNHEIYVEIGNRLASIKETNEYENTVNTIARAKLSAFSGNELPAFNYWPSLVSNEPTEYGSDNRTVTLIIEAHSKVRNEPFTDTCDKLAADVVTALNREMAAPKVSDPESLDLGGMVEEFNFTQYAYQVGTGESPICGVVITFTIKYLADSNMLYQPIAEGGGYVIVGSDVNFV